MIRLTEGLTPHLSGRLWKQYIVGAFTAVELYRLEWIKRIKKTIRSDLYNSILNSLRKVMYVVKFQKRRLPHAHMLVWLHPDDRPNTIEKIDDLVCVEIPHKETDLAGYNGHTFFDDCGFPVYQRGRMDKTIEKNKQQLDNQFIVPYNRDLLLRFQCHMNLEICNNSRSLKYLFKLLGYDIQYRYPSIERFPVHVEGGKNVTFNVNDTLEEVANKASNKKSKLEAWFVANKTIFGARDYTYQEFPRGFNWLPGQSKWKQRERGTIIRRLTEVHCNNSNF
ncbi:uncharacterized protein LOC141718683 [Apium graveolens]|uniref:uncharacterized protein LOC141718683 n=1 Tax=Apium graveolens TaxID=4045 RepID=UPI003D7ADE76